MYVDIRQNTASNPRGNDEKDTSQKLDEGYIVKATIDYEEIAELLEVGFEYEYQKDNLLYFRKRK